MSYAWEEFLDVAKELTSPGEHPAMYRARVRCAVSRAYYAVFGSACSYFASNGYAARGSGADHEGLISYLTAGGQPRDSKRLGEKLSRLKGARTWADYYPSLHPGSDFGTKPADEVIADADEALALLSKIRTSAALR